VTTHDAAPPSFQEPTALSVRDEQHLLASMRLADRAAAHGNYPFAAVLADASGNVVLEAENTVATAGDSTAHAEMNLIRAASKAFDLHELADFTLYTNAEPCAMCAAAIYWSNIRRLVFGLSVGALGGIAADAHEIPVLRISCREVFDRCGGRIEVVGPHMEAEARALQEEFWNATRRSMEREH